MIHRLSRWVTILVLLQPFWIRSQDSIAVLDNIVPNAGFEQYSTTPVGWFYRGTHFSNVMKFWSSATAASPDVFGPKVRVPDHWAERGFGDQYPRTGNSMIGVTVYGCEEGKPHCREYVQVQLLEPLVPNQNYYIEFWVSHLPRSLQTNNIGVYFSPDKMNVLLDQQISVEPDFYATEIVEADNHNWVKIAGQFAARQAADYIVLGNFFPDSLTMFKKPVVDDPLKFAYYYMDDVLLKKIPPYLDIPPVVSELDSLQLEAGKIFQLRIFFDTNKSELLPRSYQELKKLKQIMEQFPEMVIEVRGHTDNQGNDTYNYYLSQQRARAVVDYLTEQGIASNRTHYIGLGSSRPIADNAIKTGRKTNRRVEILIIRK